MTEASSPIRRPRVLLLAYACSPDHGSEPGTGWNRAVQTAKYCDTWVICEENEFAGGIRRHLAAHGPIAGLHFQFVPKKAWEVFLGRLPGMYYLSYNLWHRRAYRVARRLHRQARFDLVHQANMCGYREPGYLWKLDAPFVWGPLGGTQNFPWRFLGEAGIMGACSEALRSVANHLQLRFSRRVRKAARKAKAIFAANSTNQRDFARAHAVTPTIMVEAGMPAVAAAPRTRRADGAPLRILWSGHFRPHKAMSLLIKALARLPGDVAYELRVLGQGPYRRRWQRLARRTGAERHTTWMGWLPHQEALQQYCWADVFVFTSLRDTTGSVLLEALGAGLPVICLDHQGAGDVVTDQCGIKIPVTTPREVVVRLAEAVCLLARDTTRWEKLSHGALLRAAEFLWSRQGERMAAAYWQVLDGRFHRQRATHSKNDDHEVGLADGSPVKTSSPPAGERLGEGANCGDSSSHPAVSQKARGS